MPDNTWVLIVEHELYTRDMMSLLLTRDWRTRVTAETHNKKEMRDVVDDPLRPVDLILLDSEIPKNPAWPHDLVEQCRANRRSVPAVLCIGSEPDPMVLQQARKLKYNGYIIEHEIQYCLATAVTLSAQGWWVMTPGVRELIHQSGKLLPEAAAILDGSRPVTHFTPREHEIARLTLIFSHSQREIADEIQYKGEGQVAEVNSRIYEKLGLTDILAGEVDPAGYFEEGPVLRHFQKAQKLWQENRRSVRDKATLAFHLLTVPEIRKISRERS